MIICLSGYKFSGKDTVAQYLVDNHRAIRVALADPLKDMVAQEFGINRAWLDDPNFKEKPLLHMMVDPKDAFTKMVCEFMVKEFKDLEGNRPKTFKYVDRFYGIMAEGTYKDNPTNLFWTPRALAILRGSTNRAARSDFWTLKAIDSIQGKLDSGFPHVVVSDVRYKSEISQLKEKFGKEVVLVRINRFDTSPSTDPSERDLDHERVDYAIDNRGSLEETYRQVEELVGTITVLP